MKREGNILITLIFMMLIFWVGFTLLSFTITHNRIVKARTIKTVETDKMYQDLIYYLHKFREAVFSGKIREFQLPEQEYFNPDYFPETEVNQRHTIVPSFKYSDRVNGGFKKTRITAALDVTALPFNPGTSNHYRNNYHLSSEVVIDVLAGEIPLTYIPFLLQQDTGVPAETFLKDNNVVNKSDKNVVVDDIQTELNLAQLVADVFQIPDIEILMWRQIREKLGLETSDGPLEDGIYLLVGAGFVSAVFVQGDVEEMVFSITVSGSDHFQEIRFVINSEPYEIRYKPREHYLQCWDPSVDENSVFQETVIVNGNIASVTQGGDIAFTDTSNIKLLVSGKTVIRSSLVSEAPQLGSGQVRLTSLALATGLEQLFNKNAEPGNSEVVVDTQGKTEIQASIIADGKFVNNSEELTLTGSLYSKGLENNGVMEIAHLGPSFTGENYFKTVNYKYIHRFLINFIEEVSDE
ncbi:MAG: hypothetical protein GY940_18245 [bacterium]|nr:hypothetical protein [bacterium]